MEITGRQQQSFRETFQSALGDSKLGDARFSLAEQSIFIASCLRALKNIPLEFGQIPKGFFDIPASIQQLAKRQNCPAVTVKEQLMEDPSPLLELHRLKKPSPPIQAPTFAQPPAKKTETKTEAAPAPDKRSGPFSAREFFEEVASCTLSEGRLPRRVLGLTPIGISRALQRQEVTGLEPFCAGPPPKDFYELLCGAGLAVLNENGFASAAPPSQIERFMVRHGMPVPDSILFKPQRF